MTVNNITSMHKLFVLWVLRIFDRDGQILTTMYHPDSENVTLVSNRQQKHFQTPKLVGIPAYIVIIAEPTNKK